MTDWKQAHDDLRAAMEALAEGQCMGCFSPDHPCGSPVCDLRDEIRAALLATPAPEAAREVKSDPRPETIGSPYHHEDERECYYRADGSGWWPWRFEDGVQNRSGGTVCFRLHPAPDLPTTVQADRDAGQVRLTEEEIELRMAVLSDEAVRVAEDIWTETEPTLAEYELTERILAARQSDPDATERESLAKAWDEGYMRCSDDFERHANHCANRECDCPTDSLAANPYRRTVTTGEWTEVGE